MKKLLPLLALGLLAGIALQQRTVRRLRAEQAPLLAARNEVDHAPSSLPEPAGSTDVADEIARLKLENQELLALRNEVRQLRDRKRDDEAMHTAIAETSRPQLIKTEELANAGLSSPAATLQTAFWALASGNEGVYRQCTAREPRIRAGDFMKHYAGTNFHVSGFRIETSQLIADDQIGLAVRVFRSGMIYGQTDRFGQEAPVIMKKVGSEWKIEKADALPGLP